MTNTLTPAKRGQLALVPYKTYVANCEYPEGSRPWSHAGITRATVYAFGRVTSVTRDGIVKAAEFVGSEHPYNEHKSQRDFAGACVIVPADMTDRLWAACAAHENRFLSVEDAKAFAINYR